MGPAGQGIQPGPRLQLPWNSSVRVHDIYVGFARNPGVERNLFSVRGPLRRTGRSVTKRCELLKIIAVMVVYLYIEYVRTIRNERYSFAIWRNHWVKLLFGGGS